MLLLMKNAVGRYMDGKGVTEYDLIVAIRRFTRNRAKALWKGRRDRRRGTLFEENTFWKHYKRIIKKNRRGIASRHRSPRPWRSA